MQAATKGEQIKLPTESVMSFNLASPLTVTPTNRADHNNDGPVLNDRTNGANDNNDYSDNTTYSDQDSTDRPVLQRRPPSDNNEAN